MFEQEFLSPTKRSAEGQGVGEALHQELFKSFAHEGKDNSTDASQLKPEWALALQRRPSAERPPSNVKSQQVKSQQLSLVLWLKCPATLAESIFRRAIACSHHQELIRDGISTCSFHRHSILADEPLSDSFIPAHSSDQG